MKQTFGAFIKEKRMQKMIKLNAFAKLVGISPVYLSYLENGKRPAPSEKVLNSIIKQLSLSPSDKEKMMLLAAETHNNKTIPSDLIDYINNTEYVIEALRIAKRYNISDTIWLNFLKQITHKQ